MIMIIYELQELQNNQSTVCRYVRGHQDLLKLKSALNHEVTTQYQGSKTNENQNVSIHDSYQCECNHQQQRKGFKICRDLHTKLS